MFYNDFIKHKTKFGLQTINLKSHPKINGREYTFYHITHEGDIEKDRIQDLRRCERIPWAKNTIENCEKFGLKFWEQIRKGKHRICIWLNVSNGDNYYVIIDVRKNYILLWTAFYANFKNFNEKKEYLRWKETNKGVIKTPDELLKQIQSGLT